MNRGLYAAWLLVAGADALGCVLVAVRQYRVMHRYGTYAAAFALGVAFESACAALSLVLYPPSVEVEFAAIRIAGRLVKAAVVWAFALYLMGFINGVREPGRAK